MRPGPHRASRIALGALLLLLSVPASQAAAQRYGCKDDRPGESPFGSGEGGFTGFSLYGEEDSFYPRKNQDRNYTGGLGLDANGAFVQHAGLAWPQNFFDRLSGFSRFHCPEGDVRRRYHSAMFTGVAFTPDSLKATIVVPDDRPYASLMALSTQTISVSDNDDRVWISQFVFGALGLRWAHDVQSGIHRYMREQSGHLTPYDPAGWRYQVSDGGEPTALYRVAYEQLWTQRKGFANRISPAFGYDVSVGAEASAGYYTNAAGILRARLGVIRSAFWQVAANPMNVANQGIPRSRPTGGFPLEVLVFAGARPRFIAYNALLNGQFRESAHTFGWSRTNHFLLEFESGAEVAIPFARNAIAITFLPWVGRTAEYSGPMSRTHYWGSIFLSWQRFLDTKGS